jgi:micrococcal nuclease
MKNNETGIKRLSFAVMILTFLFVVLTHLFPKIAHSDVYDAEILRIIDGDTVVIAAPFLPSPLKPQLAIRVFGVDTPEKSWRGKCEYERNLGQMASDFTKQLILSSTRHQVDIMKWDKFGGRVLGDILLDGKSLRKMLIENGYAREYYGKKKQSWCDDRLFSLLRLY